MAGVFGTPCCRPIGSRKCKAQEPSFALAVWPTVNDREAERIMGGSLAKLTIVLFILGFGAVSYAESGAPAPDQDAAAIHTEMLGAPVFAADGVLIGQVSDISYDEEDQPQRIRMTSASALGLGTRVLEIPAGLFTVLRGAVVVDLPAEAVQALPELVEQEDER
jgi:sporulation protein YlmC with PRC-barrel domain